jgi:hypothetical protein
MLIVARFTPADDVSTLDFTSVITVEAKKSAHLYEHRRL